MTLKDLYSAVRRYFSGTPNTQYGNIPEKPRLTDITSVPPKPSLENLATNERPINLYDAEIPQPERDPMSSIPNSIRAEDRHNLQRLLEGLKAPYLNVIVSPDDNMPNYEAIRVLVRAKALPKDFDLQNYMSTQPLVEELGLKTLLELSSRFGGVPRAAATDHVFGVLRRLAEQGSYNTQVTRGEQPLDYAQGDTQLRIGSTLFNIFYSEDSRGVTERRPQVINLGNDRWIVMEEEFPR